MKNVGKDTDKLEFVMQPSQWINVGWFFTCIGMAFISPYLGIFFGLIWLWKFFVVKFWVFQFNEKTLAERKGVFSVSTREIHYYRIKSVRLEEPFLYRLVGLSTIDIITSDPLIPVMRILAIGKGSEMRNHLKDLTSFWRKEQGVKEYDLN